MSDSVEINRKTAYELVDTFIRRRTVAHPEQRGVKEAELKTSLCADGSLSVEQVNTALRALGEQDKIQYGSGCIVPVVDQQYHKDAIAWLADRDDPPRELIGMMNKSLQTHDWP